MTRSERVRAACERFAEGRPDEMAETVNQGIEAALDAALADVGGLDGLTLLADLTDQSRPMEDRKAQLITTEFYERLLAAAADRDRLRNALRKIAAGREDDRYDGMEDVPGQRLSRTALREVAALALHRSESEALS